MDIKLNKIQREKYLVIKDTVDGNLTNLQASIKIGCSKRTIINLKNEFVKNGKLAFVHKNTKRIPINKKSETEEKDIIERYEKYKNYNFTHFLEENLDIKATDKTVTRILNNIDVHSPQQHKRKNSVANHPLREPRENFGELVQMDACSMDWIGFGEKWHLHLAIDDSNKQPIAAHFEKQETLHGYLVLLAVILISYGVPKGFYTDYRTVFEFLKENKLEEKIQFKRICKNLGIEMFQTKTPQAKGRVERANRTFKDRLSNELKHNSIKTIDEANKYLNEVFIPKYTKRFALPVNIKKIAFKKLLKDFNINTALAKEYERKILSGDIISFENREYKVVDDDGKPVGFYNKDNIIVVKTFDEKLVCRIDNLYLNLKFFKDKANDPKSHPHPKNHPWTYPKYYGIPME